MGPSAADRALIAGIRAALAAAGDPERAAAQQRYMRSAMPFRGVRVPEVRRLTGALVRERPAPDVVALERTVRALWDGASFREERYAALAVLRHPAHRHLRTAAMLPLCRDLIVSGAWWDLVDETAHVVGELLATDPEALAPQLRAWATEPDMWLRRVAIICQLGRGAATDTAMLEDAILANAGDREFFIRKAIRWALRQYARTDPPWVRAFLARHELAPLSVREARKHL